ncbi:class I SAM-dependent methyltransferase [Herbaspirillum sp. B65]|uniref:class I SAM-dependent methyltransferase n=1 Tax=Herbaspirillum sp. B65 TaxID=137708 RepID=UPI000349E003|nr:class I SAM-dependent methyltransferase [Herbaspirillum sp. B65]
MSSKNPFANIGFEDFRRLAADQNLTKYERIGFPNSYREGYEPAIFADICSKVLHLSAQDKKVLDIGPGCSDLPLMLIELCERQRHALTLVDNQEMLDLLPNTSTTRKVAALYPNCPELIELDKGSFDVILCYSVLHYVLVDTAFFRFLDTSLSLLAPGGQMLIGDIPNISKRKRFFASETGIRFHQEFMKTNDLPVVHFNQVEHDQIDDAVVMAIVQRARAQGFDAYVLPQHPSLPMANRREDILIHRP